jgi:hypothetical protein
MEDIMQVTTFDIALEDGVIIDGKLQGTSSKLRAQVLGIWNRLPRAVPAGRTPLYELQAPSGYYADAYKRASAAVPVVSFRGLA